MLRQKKMVARMLASPLLVKKCEEAIQAVDSGHHPLYPLKRRTFQLVISSSATPAESDKISEHCPQTANAKQNSSKTVKEIFHFRASTKSATRAGSLLSPTVASSVSPLKTFSFSLKKKESERNTSVPKPAIKSDPMKQFKFTLREPSSASPFKNAGSSFGLTKNSFSSKYPEPPPPPKIEQPIPPPPPKFELCTSCVKKKNSMIHAATQVEPRRTSTKAVQVDMSGDTLAVALSLDQERNRLQREDEMKRRKEDEERKLKEQEIERRMKELDMERKKLELETERRRKEFEEERKRLETEKEMRKIDLEIDRRKEPEDDRKRKSIEEEERRPQELIGKRKLPNETHDVDDRPTYRPLPRPPDFPTSDSLSQILEMTLHGKTNSPPAKVPKPMPAPFPPSSSKPTMQPIHAQLQAIYAHAFQGMGSTSNTSPGMSSSHNLLSSREKLRQLQFNRKF